MTKIEIIKTLDARLTNEILEKFYSITIADYSGGNPELRIQADYTSDLVFNLNNQLNIDSESKEDDAPKWIVGNSGYMHLTTQIRGILNDVTVKLTITLA